MKVKRFKDLNESVDYDLDNETEDSVQYCQYYIDSAERAVGEKVVKVEGSVTDADTDLYLTLESGTVIHILYVFDIRHGYTKVTVTDDYGTEIGHKSYGKALNKRGENPEYEDVDLGEDIYMMIRDIYRENGEINYTHQIALPREIFGNDPYFKYDSDEETDQNFVYFESEEAAKQWINSLKINILK